MNAAVYLSAAFAAIGLFSLVLAAAIVIPKTGNERQVVEHLLWIEERDQFLRLAYRAIARSNEFKQHGMWPRLHPDTVLQILQGTVDVADDVFKELGKWERANPTPTLPDPVKAALLRGDRTKRNWYR